YQGALEGLGVSLMLASSSSGALTNTENTSTKVVMASAATNSTARRWGHTWTLSCGSALTSWIDPALTTVRRRWVWPEGPAAAGGGAAVATAAAAPPAVAMAPTSAVAAFWSLAALD